MDSPRQLAGDEPAISLEACTHGQFEAELAHERPSGRGEQKPRAYAGGWPTAGMDWVDLFDRAIAWDVTEADVTETLAVVREDDD